MQNLPEKKEGPNIYGLFPITVNIRPLTIVFTYCKCYDKKWTSKFKWVDSADNPEASITKLLQQ